jgi:hypothetical protein
MRKMRILLLSFVLALVLNVSGQTRDYDFKVLPMGNKIQSEIGEDFYFVTFYIQGIKTDVQRKALEKGLNANPNFKQVRILSNNEFRGFVNRELQSKEVRKLLVAQAVDFKIDRQHFKIMGACHQKTQN